MAGLVRRVFRGKFGPLRPAAQYPQHSVPHSTGIVPRAAAIILAPRRTQNRFHQCPLFISQFPAALPSSTCGDALSTSSFAQIRPQIVYEIGSSRSTLGSLEKSFERRETVLVRPARRPSIVRKVREVQTYSEGSSRYLLGFALEFVVQRVRGDIV
jgi:hypothetical protein